MIEFDIMDWWFQQGRSPMPIFSNISDTIIGALVAAAIGVIGQLIVIYSNARQRKKDGRERLLADTHSLFIKLTKLYSNIKLIHDHVEGAIANDRLDGDKVGLWQIVMPLANPPAHISFISSELSALISADAKNVLNRVIVLDDVHNDLVNLITLYAKLRQELVSTLPAVMEGDAALIELKPGELKLIGPKSFQLNDLMAKIRERCTMDLEKARQAIDEFNDAMNAGLNAEFKFRYERTDKKKQGTA